MDNLDHSASSTVVATAGQIIRKLSHSKIITHHFPAICEKSISKEAVDLISVEEPEESSKEYYEDDDPPPEIRINKKRPEGLKGLPCGKYLGLILALMASVTLSLVTLIVKTMPQYHPFSLVIWRLQGVLFPSICMISYLRFAKGTKIFDSFWPLNTTGKWTIALLLVIRGLLGCSADIFQYCSLKYLSLADSSVISFSSPIFVTFVAYFVLGEQLGVVPILTGVMSLVGVIIIARPPMLTGAEKFDADVLTGNALALGCMIMATLTFVTLRKLRTVHFTLTTFSFGFFGTLESVALCGVISTFELPQGTHDWVLVSTIAFMFFLGQLFFTLALQLEEAGPVSLVRSCDAIFAYIWQFLFLDVVPDAYSVIGGAVVISGVVIIAFRKFLLELPEENSRRKAFSLLLK